MDEKTNEKNLFLPKQTMFQLKDYLIELMD
jgi:hypothetical protein